MTKRKGKPRRENGAGSVFRRADSRWCATVTMENGKRAARYAKTEDEARELLKDLRRRAEQGRLIGTDRQSLAQFLAQWLEYMERFQKVREHSLWVYRSRLQHVIDHCGTIRLHELKREHLERCYTTLMDPKHEKLSPSTVHDIHGVTKLALKHAVKWELIQQSPADLADSPRRNSKTRKILEVDQVRVLLELTQGSPYHALWTLLATTGMRIGEALALKWEAVDLETGQVRIEHTTNTPQKGGVVLGPVKTKAALRTVPLSREAIIALKLHGTMMKEREMKMRVWLGQDVVFPNTTGGFMRTSTPSLALKRATEAAGLSGITPHNLRHTAATRLIEEGHSPRTVQELLGHESVNTTLATYSQVSPRMLQAVADQWDAWLTPASGE